MAVLEALIGLLFVISVLVVVLLVLLVVPRQLRKWRYSQSLEGRIEHKTQELAAQDSYLQELVSEIASSETSEARRSILKTYQELATLKRNQLALELEALKAEKDTREFEKTMERRRQ